VDDLWARKNEDIGLIVRTVSFQDFQPMWSWSTNVTDGQTDSLDDMRSQDRALHYVGDGPQVGTHLSKNTAGADEILSKFRRSGLLRWRGR